MIAMFEVWRPSRSRVLPERPWRLRIGLGALALPLLVAACAAGARIGWAVAAGLVAS